MKYHERLVESKLLRMALTSPAVLVTGARQCGKSTLLKHLFGDKAAHIIFDPVIDIGNARQDPEFFLNQNPTPRILDEIQYAPELLPALKRRIDRDATPGQYFLSGSQNLSVIKHISESLAGRVLVLDLWNFTLSERLNETLSLDKTWHTCIFDSATDVDLALFTRLPAAEAESVYSVLWRGGMPGLLNRDNADLPDYFQSYIRTYIERDIRTIAEVSDQQLFSRFVMLTAALTAQEINYSQLGRELGITHQTAMRWLNILKSTFQWIEISAYSGNTVKRVSGRSKGYIADTGIAAYLQRISTPQALSGHPLLGALFETHVVVDLCKRFGAMSTPPCIYHWRLHSGNEVDLVLERDGVFRPVEIKCTGTVKPRDAAGIHAFRRTFPNLAHGPGFIIAPVEQAHALSKDIFVIPYDCI